MNAYGTKISKSRMGSPRFAGSDEPENGPVKTYKLSDEELEKYRGGKKMNGEQAQQAERAVNPNDELKKLEEEVAELSKGNVKLQNLLDDLQEKYNKLALDYETAEQVRYDLTRAEGQIQQLTISKKETEEVLKEEVNKREALERLVRLYV